MRIGEFVKHLNTTKDTVRHYEQLGLLNPVRASYHKEYTPKEIMDFEIIVKLKLAGLNLKDIQIIFDLKKTYGCGSIELANEVFKKLDAHVELLKEEEEKINRSRTQLESEIKSIKHMLQQKQGHSGGEIT